MRPNRDDDESNFPPGSVLIVDDSPGNLLAFRAVLEPLGHRLVTAQSGAEALARAEEGDFAVVVMDVNMPGMDGLETAARMRARPSIHRPPLIFITAANTEPDRLLAAYALGAIDFLTKPVPPEILSAKVSALVSLYRRGEELKRRGALVVATQHETAIAMAARMRAEQANCLKDTYLGILGHDLRTPAAVISAAAQSLVRNPEFPEAVHRSAERILRGVGRMTNMISDLIDLTRGQLGGGIPVSPTRVDFADICRAVIDELRASDLQCEIIFRKEGDLGGVWDSERVHQALSNLIANAVHHGTGPVHVRVWATSDCVVLSVHNQGTPIPPEAITSIFEPFRKSQASSPGLGLGLYIVREIVRSHGGIVEVTSSAEDGTTFVSRWPRFLARGSAELVDEASRASSMPKGVRPVTQPADADVRKGRW
jgi:signal transduction histidine kinase